jgi:uncharacterized protein with von Willebrand factor type A (vWA) domain
MVIEIFEEEPETSISIVARNLQISTTSVQRILKDEDMHSFLYTTMQCLTPDDYPLRVAFCNWILQKHEENENFVKSILFTDESCFQ